MTNGFAKSKKADVSEKYNHVRGELKRARERIRELEDHNGLLAETLDMRNGEIENLKTAIKVQETTIRSLLPKPEKE